MVLYQLIAAGLRCDLVETFASAAMKEARKSKLANHDFT